MNKAIKLSLTLILAAGVLIGCKAKTGTPSQTASPPAAGTTTAPLARPTTTSTPPAAPTENAPASSPQATATPQAATATPANPTDTQAAPTAEATEQPAPTAAATAASSPTATPAGQATSAASATSQATETPQSASQSACTNVAAFFKDVTVEDYTFFSQSEPFVKTWQVRNAGTCTWGAGYTIFFDSGFTFDAPDSSPLPAAGPGEIVEISLDMTAPNRGGQYMSRWRFKNADGQIFGVGQDSGQLFTIINVGFIEPTSAAPQPTSPPSGVGTQPTPVPGSSGGGSCNYSLDQSFSQQLVAIINQARQQAGLNALDVQSQLAAAAQEHSIDIACHDSYDHIGSDGSVWTDRVARQGYSNYTSARENIRVGDPVFGFSPQYVFDQWFNSQIHHDNMYYPAVTEIGISCVLNPNTEYKEFCTAVFARP